MGFWEKAEQSCGGTVIEEDFEAAACRLIHEQVLYGAEGKSRKAYDLIQRFEREFRTALEPLGISLKVNTTLRYACAIPQYAKTPPLTVEQTLLALVLRKIYDEESRVGQMNENGEVVCDLETLEVKYKQATNGRQLPMAGGLNQLMHWMSRWGIAATVGASNHYGQHGEQPFSVVIKPGIAEVLSESALARLALFGSEPGSVEPSEIDGDVDESVSQDEDFKEVQS